MPRDQFGKNKKWSQHKNRQLNDVTEEKILNLIDKPPSSGLV